MIMSEIVVPQGVCSCIFCGEQLLWKSDVPFEEMGLQGEGMLDLNLITVLNGQNG